MNEQLRAFDGWTPAAPPPVPPMVALPHTVRYRILTGRKPRCGHCQLVKHAQQSGLPVPGWTAEQLGQFRVLDAVYDVTQTDGSTLQLCAQHADDHQQRGDRHE